MTKDWLEKKDRKMELKDCSADALNVAVNFMYGIKVPEHFTQLPELLHLAELFLMGNLSDVVVERLAKELTKDNYLEISKTAELYNKDSLISKCALFVYDQMADNVDWEVMGKLPKCIVDLVLALLASLPLRASTTFLLPPIYCSAPLQQLLHCLAVCCS